eukprot:scaffold2045_cov404-Prasinococcus_capsulatus_cf.AAC.76
MGLHHRTYSPSGASPSSRAPRARAGTCERMPSCGANQTRSAENSHTGAEMHGYVVNSKRAPFSLWIAPFSIFYLHATSKPRGTALLYRA